MGIKVKIDRDVGYDRKVWNLEVQRPFKGRRKNRKKPASKSESVLPGKSFWRLPGVFLPKRDWISPRLTTSPNAPMSAKAPFIIISKTKKASLKY